MDDVVLSNLAHKHDTRRDSGVWLSQQSGSHWLEDQADLLKLHRKIAGLFGYELLKKRKLNDTLEQHLSNVFDLLEINVVLDVGANVGQYAKILRHCGCRNRIVSFEPQASSYGQLETASALDDHWTVYQLALGCETSSVAMNHQTSHPFELQTATRKNGSNGGWK